MSKSQEEYDDGDDDDDRKMRNLEREPGKLEVENAVKCNEALTEKTKKIVFSLCSLMTVR
jgi:hypothetical protein